MGMMDRTSHLRTHLTLFGVLPEMLFFILLTAWARALCCLALTRVLTCASCHTVLLLAGAVLTMKLLA
jgi:hypothetical protein